MQTKVNPLASVYTPTLIFVICWKICLHTRTENTVNDWLCTHKHTDQLTSLKSACSGINTAFQNKNSGSGTGLTSVPPLPVLFCSPMPNNLQDYNSSCIKGSVTVSRLTLDEEPTAEGNGLTTVPLCMAAFWAVQWEIEACSLCPFSLFIMSSIMLPSTRFDLSIQLRFTQ